MSTTGHRLFRTTLLPAFLFCAAILPAQATELQLAAVNTNDRPLLHVMGSPGTKYTVEQSLNMSDWFSVYSAVATNGALEYLDSPFHGRSAFYRARPASAPLIVQPVVDTNRVGVGLIRTNGGTCEVMAANGTRFELTVPSNTVPEGVLITLTVITNLGGVPGDGLFPAAVRLEPDGLEFMGAALLEIERRRSGVRAS